MSDPKEFRIPEIYKGCSHPQSVWFDEHWRPILDALAAEVESTQSRIKDLEVELFGWKHDCEAKDHEIEKLKSTNALYREALEKIAFRGGRDELTDTAKSEVARKSLDEGEG